MQLQLYVCMHNAVMLCCAMPCCDVMCCAMLCRHHEEVDAATFAEWGVDYLKVSTTGTCKLAWFQCVCALHCLHSRVLERLVYTLLCLCASRPSVIHAASLVIMIAHSVSHSHPHALTHSLSCWLADCACCCCDQQYDNCYSEEVDIKERYMDMRDALNKTGRPI